MRIIDSNSGRDVRPGDVVTNVDGTWRLHGVRFNRRLFPSRAVFVIEYLAHPPGREIILRHDGSTKEGPARRAPAPLGRLVKVPGIVRYLHPSFPLQSVAFIPS